MKTLYLLSIITLVANPCFCQGFNKTIEKNAQGNKITPVKEVFYTDNHSYADFIKKLKEVDKEVFNADGQNIHTEIIPLKRETTEPEIKYIQKILAEPLKLKH